MSNTTGKPRLSRRHFLARTAAAGAAAGMASLFVSREAGGTLAATQAKKAPGRMFVPGEILICTTANGTFLPSDPPAVAIHKAELFVGDKITPIIVGILNGDKLHGGKLKVRGAWTFLPRQSAHQKFPKTTVIHVEVTHSNGASLTPDAAVKETARGDSENQLAWGITLDIINKLTGRAVCTASPNWYIVAASDGFVLGGPGGLPNASVPQIMPGYRWPRLDPGAGPTPTCIPSIGSLPTRSTSKDLVLQSHPPSKSVKIWVLDTRPQSLTNLTGSLKHQNSAVRFNNLTAWNYVDDETTWLATACSSARNDISSHGLFVAGIVNKIATYNELNVVRVLNDFGVGTADGLLAALHAIDQSLTSQPTSRFVVNLSLYVTVPTTKNELDSARLWFSQTGLDQTILKTAYSGHDPYTSGALALTSIVHGPMQALAATGNVFFVAAAGNDGDLDAPRVPALYSDTSFSVAAIDAQGNRAPYSNASRPKATTGVSLTAFNNGIATFGGTLSTMDAGTSCTSSSNPTPVMGLSGSPGQVVGWAGTSFATAFITGLTANLLSNTSTPWTMQSLLQALQGLSGNCYSDDLECPVILASGQ